MIDSIRTRMANMPPPNQVKQITTQLVSTLRPCPIPNSQLEHHARTHHQAARTSVLDTGASPVSTVASPKSASLRQPAAVMKMLEDLGADEDEVVFEGSVAQPCWPGAAAVMKMQQRKK